MDIYTLVMNNDTNYIVGILVIILSAKLLQDRNRPGGLKNRSKVITTIQNALFLSAIVVISYTNIVLGVILSILFLSLNM